ncbi:MAG TPA: magnesium chelatase [Clostridiales bacterium]|nr:magnesium chelatase [Clostridiales bacterium]
MFSKVYSCGLHGINGFIIDVEIDISDGLPNFDIVGLPDSAIKEAKERVKASIKNSEFLFPIKRITVNLAPANTRKEGASFDLPIAIGVLAATGMVDSNRLADTIFLGELSLDGNIRPINGVLPMIYHAKNIGFTKCFLPKDNAIEGAIVKGIDVIGVSTLSEIVDFFNASIKLEPTIIDISQLMYEAPIDSNLDFSDVKGQENVKRALEIAAAGYHNVLVIGPPGSGKTMMAKRVPTILPDLSFEESIEITKVYSISGLLSNKNSLVATRPFRSPHHNISASALTGGGKYPKPGEVSLSHNGVLFLDELPEFSKNVLEVLRQPLEDREVTISRVNGSLTFPSNFMLITALNPCPCGYYPDSNRCHCSQESIKRYLGKISGPLLDRLDLHVEAAAVKYENLDTSRKGDSSSVIRARVVAAHTIQQARYKTEGIFFNSQLSASQIEKFCVIDENGKRLLKAAFDKLNLSARSYHRILKICRTIADLARSEDIKVNHITEAIQYRSLDRKYWD